MLATILACSLSSLLSPIPAFASEKSESDVELSETDTTIQETETLVSGEQKSEVLVSDDELAASAEAMNGSTPQKKSWLFLHQYYATYVVYSDEEKLGTATRALSFSNDGWKLQMTTRLKKWMLSLKSNEFSEFNIRDNQLKTQRFYTSSKVTFKSARVIEQLFNWKEKVEKGSRDKNNWELPIESQVFDRMSHLVQLRADLLSGTKNLEYLVSYKGSRKSYLYSVEGKEVLKTALGEIESLKIVRVKGDDSKFSIWLSPEHNYFPVKIAQIEQDKPDVVMEVSSFEYRGNKVAPSDLAVMTNNEG